MIIKIDIIDNSFKALIIKWTKAQKLIDSYLH
jgi:hypothetical protein